MPKRMQVFLNCTRNGVLALPPALRKIEAMKEAKMFVVAKSLRCGTLDIDIPDKLASEEMAERYLEITPPMCSVVIPAYQSIVNEIEQSYVLGNDFSALSASCVVIERLLNQARIVLHKHHKDKVIKELWGKGPTNEWHPNIEALRKWHYLDDAFASELSDIYCEVRCRYLHCGEIQSLRNDARRAVAAAYRLMTILVGFPEDLFEWKNGALACKNDADARYLEFYEPNIQAKQLHGGEKDK
jgi:hypothetical protein